LPAAVGDDRVGRCGSTRGRSLRGTMTSSDATPRVLRIAAPALIAVVLLALVADRALLAESLSVTLGIALTALAISVVIGTLVALVFVQSRWIEMSLFPYAV